MNKISVTLCMIFAHIVDDYYLQGWLASAKQKQWWKDNAPDALYQYDYIAALAMHSMSWSFMILLPIMVYNGFNLSLTHAIIFMVNTLIHAITDNAKANKKTINLIIDQSIHMVQIFITAAVCLLICQI